MAAMPRRLSSAAVSVFISVLSFGIDNGTNYRRISTDRSTILRSGNSNVGHDTFATPTGPNGHACLRGDGIPACEASATQGCVGAQIEATIRSKVRKIVDVT